VFAQAVERISLTGKTNSNGPVIHAVVLAAGKSSRLGSPKQLIPYAGSTLLGYIIDQVIAAKFASVTVVLGHESTAIKTSLASIPGRLEKISLVINSAYEVGISTSIQCGLDVLPKSADGVAWILGDQPALSVWHLNRLVAEFANSASAQDRAKLIVASYYGDSVGVPAVFGQSWVDELRRLQGDQGAKKLMLSAGKNLRSVPFEGGEWDIDVPGDLERILVAENR
jgi:molybdenum cofactor cytidylyltransferase